MRAGSDGDRSFEGDAREVDQTRKRSYRAGKTYRERELITLTIN